MKYAIFAFIMLLTINCNTNNKPVTPEQNKCDNKISCPLSLEQQICIIKDKTLDGKVEWKRSNGTFGPYFTIDMPVPTSDEIRYARLMVGMYRATFWLSDWSNKDESFDVKNDCAKDLYTYLDNATKDAASNKREKILNDFLNSIQDKEAPSDVCWGGEKVD